jgi:hypothetical protein
MGRGFGLRPFFIRNRLAAIAVASALLSAPRAAATLPNVVLVTLDAASRCGIGSISLPDLLQRG